MVENKIKIYNTLLYEFKKVNIDKKPVTRTFMQVSGYPHFENVCSNILAFLFTTDEEHGFNELFLKSLIEAAGINEKIQLDNISVEREFITSNNKRLDLVLTNDTIMIGIENKLFSGVHNDLQEYTNTLKKLALGQGQKVIMIILSLNDESKIAGANDYINVTYDMLFDKIKKNFGDFIQDENNTWLIYLKDFMKTILALKGSDDDMNAQLLDFIQKNSEEVGSFLGECSELKKIMTAKTKELSTFVDLEEYKKDMEFTAWCYNPKTYLTSSFVIDIIKEKNQILVVEVFIDSGGWHISYLGRNGGIETRKVLESKLKDMGINYSCRNKMDTPESLFLVIADYPYDESYNVIQKGIYEAMDIARRIKLDYFKR